MLIFQIAESHTSKTQTNTLGAIHFSSSIFKRMKLCFIRVKTTNVEKLQKDANVYLVLQPFYMCLPGMKETKGFGGRPKVARKKKDRERWRGGFAGDA